MSGVEETVIGVDVVDKLECCLGALIALDITNRMKVAGIRFTPEASRHIVDLAKRAVQQNLRDYLVRKETGGVR
jgi:hypothetical protein